MPSLGPSRIAFFAKQMLFLSFFLKKNEKRREADHFFSFEKKQSKKRGK
jgi:hypothetical protein